jgi:hypothetical protein
MALAAWLEHQSEQAEAAANSDGDEYGARATLETAARLAQASRVVKKAADRECGAGHDKPGPSAARDPLRLKLPTRERRHK